MTTEGHLPEQPDSAPPPGDDARQIYQRRLIALILALAVASFAFRLLFAGGLRHSAAVFIGIPTLLAVLVVKGERPETGTGVVMRVVTLALLLSGIVFTEGMVCILLAAPIFYFVAYVITKAMIGITEAIRWRRGFMLLSLLLLPTGVEGTIPGAEWNRHDSVTASRVVRATPAQVRDALAARPDFDTPLPPFLRLGFPVPVATSGRGFTPGDERTIVFEHVHGGHRERGTLVMRTAKSDSTFVRFTPIRDDSYVTHWLAWESAEVRWQATSATETRVEWTLRYKRRLDPAWYFAPLERYGVGVAAGYLVEALATPSVRESRMPVATDTMTEHAHGS